MDVNVILELDYETQHFGFHPRGFIDGVYNSTLHYARDGLDAMQKCLAEEYKAISKEDAQNRAQAMMQLFTQKLDKAVDRLEIFLNHNVFTIPNHVVLPEDRVHITNPTTKEQNDELDKEHAELRLKIIQAKHKQALLKAKIQQQEIVKERQMLLRSRFKQLNTVASESGIPDLHESVRYHASKIQELCDLTSSDGAKDGSKASISRLT